MEKEYKSDEEEVEQELSEEEVEQELSEEEAVSPAILEPPSTIEESPIIVVIKEENWVTTDVMSLYEMTECISLRATQIAEHNNCMVPIDGLTDPVHMAKRELMMRKCPLTLRRLLGKKVNEKGELVSYYEYRDPNTMKFASSYDI